MTRKLVVESRATKVKVLEAAEDGSFRFEATVSEADYTNANRRRYPMEVLWPAFERMKNRLEMHPGLVDHPGFFDPASVSDVGIMWEDFWKEGNLIVGRGRIIPTAKGKDLEAAMAAGVHTGFSTRGYGDTEEQTIDGQTVNVMVAYDFAPDGSVDAVINPSVRHARIRNFRKEDLDMDEELKQALEAKGAAEGKLAEAQAALTTATERVTTLESQNADLTAKLDIANARIAELEAAEAGAAAQRAENELTAKLNELVEGHPFAPAIIAEARELGVTVENAERLVPRLKALVEAAASQHNEGEGGNPRGDLRTDEDADPKTDDEGDEGTDEATMELIRAARL